MLEPTAIELSELHQRIYGGAKRPNDVLIAMDELCSLPIPKPLRSLARSGYLLENHRWRKEQFEWFDPVLAVK